MRSYDIKEEGNLFYYNESIAYNVQVHHNKHKIYITAGMDNLFLRSCSLETQLTTQLNNSRYIFFFFC